MNVFHLIAAEAQYATPPELLPLTPEAQAKLQAMVVAAYRRRFERAMREGDEDALDKVAAALDQIGEHGTTLGASLLHRGME